MPRDGRSHFAERAIGDLHDFPATRIGAHVPPPAARTRTARRLGEASISRLDDA